MKNILCVVVAAALAATGAQAQKTSKTRAAPAASAPPEQVFDPYADKVDMPFRGNSPSGLYRAFKVHPELCIEGSTDTAWTTVPMEPDEARASKDFLSAVMLGRPAAPFIRVTEDFQEATVSEPTQIHITRLHLVLDMFGLLVYDSRTGAILFRPPSLENEIRQRATDTSGPLTAKP